MEDEEIEGWGEIEKVPRMSKRIPGPTIENLTAKDLVERLQMFGGDIFKFTQSYGRINGTREAILAKALKILRSKGNEVHMHDWEELVEQYRTMQLLIMQRKAIQRLKGMPSPTDTDSVDKWIKWGQFWTKIDPSFVDKKDSSELVEEERRAAAVQSIISEMKRGKE